MTQYREIYGKQSTWGKVWKFMFIGWQILMIYWFLSSTLDSAGSGLGIMVSWMVILMFWTTGTVVLGTFVFLTRRTKALVKIDEEKS